MEEESLGWMFVNSVPLQYEKKRLSRQAQIETWLDLNEVTKELGIEKSKAKGPDKGPTAGYVV